MSDKLFGWDVKGVSVWEGDYMVMDSEDSATFYRVDEVGNVTPFAYWAAGSMAIEEFKSNVWGFVHGKKLEQLEAIKNEKMIDVLKKLEASPERYLSVSGDLENPEADEDDDETA